MTLFDALAHAAARGLSTFLPISASAHHWLLTELAGLPLPDAATQAAAAWGILAALLLFYRHDWSSVISSFIQILVFRRKPMTLDERMPFFLVIATLPVIALGPTLAHLINSPSWPPLAWLGVLAGGAGLLALADRASRKNRRWVDWNWIDALIAGLAQGLALVPGFGRIEAVWLAASLRSYTREAAYPFACYALLPLLTLDLIRLNPLSALSEGAPWWHDATVAIIACLTGLAALGAVHKGLRQGRALGGYLVYRLLLAGGAVLYLAFWKGGL
ncbi:MAG: hypothetical protein IT285_09415 [Bdellovibrionales bacterium]|nr:hypothetical protein [Bdellovibrionales bacterium]